MDADKALAEMREGAAKLVNVGPDDDLDDAAIGEWWAERAEWLAAQFMALDAHLSAGGRPPTAWVEGPDAPERDDDTVRDALCHAYLDVHTMLDERPVGAYRLSRTQDALAAALRAVGLSGADALGYDPEPLGGPVPGTVYGIRPHRPMSEKEHDALRRAAEMDLPPRFCTRCLGDLGDDGVSVDDQGRPYHAHCFARWGAL